MKNQMIKIGAAVPSLKVGDVSYNAEQIITMIHAHQDHGLLVFPELCITGYTCADLFGHTLLLEKAEEALIQIAETTEHGMTVVLGAPIRFENGLYNCAVFVSGGRICGIVPKTYLPSYSEFYETRWFTSGKDVIGRSVLIGDHEIPFGIDLLMEDEKSGVVIGAEICEDLWVADKPGTHCALAGANILVNPSASDEVIGKQDYRRRLVQSQSGDCYCGYVYSSCGVCESSTDLVFSGHCLIAENGHLLADSVYPEENSVTSAVLDLETIAYNRRHANTFESVSGGWYRHAPVEVKCLGGAEDVDAHTLSVLLKKEGYAVARKPFVPSAATELSRRCSRILQIQANGLATRVRATGIHRLVIGISGGLDSTLALIVCNEARKLVPQISILGITMPNEGNTSSTTYQNALDLMKSMDVEIREVSIGKGVASHLQDIGHPGVYQGEFDTAYENAQARMRTYILMDTANMENGLVVGTGDLSELALGWCTYNGDHMSMYAVNSSVPKTLVQDLCRSYADLSDNELLKKTLYAIIDTPISPELTPTSNGQIAQKTEEKIGRYDLNDFFLYWMLRYGSTPGRILALAYTAYPEQKEEEIKESLKRFYKRFFSQQFKRSCLPDGPKVGSVTLSPRGDWRMPSDASAAMWLRELEEN